MTLAHHKDLTRLPGRRVLGTSSANASKGTFSQVCSRSQRASPGLSAAHTSMGTYVYSGHPYGSLEYCLIDMDPWNGTQTLSPTGKTGILEDSLSLEIPQLYQMSSPSTSCFARTTTIGHQQLLCATISLPGLSPPPVTPSNSHWPRWGTCKTQQPPPNAKNTGSWRFVPFFLNGQKSHQGHQRPCPALAVTSSQLSAFHFCYHIFFCWGAANGSSWTWTFWVNFQSIWFRGPAHHMAGQALLAGRKMRTETDSALLSGWSNSGSNPVLQSERSQAHWILTPLSEPRPCPALTC